jgi:uncharacterized protein YjcR
LGKINEEYGVSVSQVEWKRPMAWSRCKEGRSGKDIPRKPTGRTFLEILA